MTYFRKESFKKDLTGFKSTQAAARGPIRFEAQLKDKKEELKNDIRTFCQSF